MSNHSEITVYYAKKSEYTIQREIRYFEVYGDIEEAKTGIIDEQYDGASVVCVEDEEGNAYAVKWTVDLQPHKPELAYG